jgi:hypothetical protein
MKKLIFLFSLLLASIIKVDAQQLIWRNPLSATPAVLNGQALAETIGPNYQRLADAQQAGLRKEVWDLSLNTAGLYIEFKTNAKEINVRYTTKGMRAMNHMPATGVSGLDLYVKDGKKWLWTSGQYSFKDTVSYKFGTIPPQKGVFRLYLPLYTGVTWLEIGVDDTYDFAFVPAATRDKAVMIYGTSIAQGGCASRPGLAWPAIFGRKINEPVINLGFSGNGRLEQPITDIMAEQAAKLFILDCIPNLGSQKLYPEAELRKRIFAAVETLQAKQNGVPILLVEHSGGNANQLLDTGKNDGFRQSSAILNKLYKELKAKGKKNIHLLTTKEIGLTTESTVDGAHPNDIGMLEHAIAFEKKYKEIFKLK